MSTSSYAYQPLRDESSIRVLLLEPASVQNAPLVATLQHVNIACQTLDSKEADTNQPQYEAVSYAWGDEEPTVPLDISGARSAGPIMIRPNVDTMLRYLRLPDQPRCLWIDALCIDQEDTTEQASQVQHMGEVYRQARSVVVWLGPPANAHDRIDHFFDDLAKYADGPDGKERKATWSRLQVLLDRTWFKRRWIIQEAILAKQATMRCGNYSVNFMVFAKNAWLMSQRQPYFKNPVSGIVRKLWTMYRLRSVLVPDVRSDILSLLVEFSTAQCSNERDRIYALNALTDVQARVSYTDSVKKVYMDYAELHLVRCGNLAVLNCGGAFRSTDSSMPSWVPDWRNLPGYVPLVTNITTPKLDTHRSTERAAAALHDASGRITLCINGIKLGTVTRVGYGAPFPVWGGDILRLLQDWYSVFDRNISKSARRTSPDTVANQFIKTLTLGAVGKRTNAPSLGHPSLNDDYSEETPGVTPILAHLFRESRDMNTDAPWSRKDQADLRATAAKMPDGLTDALKNLTYAPSSPFSDPRPASNALSSPDSTSFLSPKGHTEDPYARNLRAPELVDLLCRTIAGRTVFWNSDGAFGLGPANVEPGDVVVAIPACPTPYVLRPKGASSPLAWIKGLGASGDEEVYKLVGDCYVQDFEPGEGFANGRALKRLQIV